MTKTAVVLLSGGLDSATVLAITQASGYEVSALSFDYGQRHSSELEAARRVAAAAGVTDHRVAKIDLRVFGGSALTDSAIPVPDAGTGAPIPATYVPARNTIFLSFALAMAETIEAAAIGIGVNAVDYSGYPDCRPAFIDAFQTLAHLATRNGVEGRGPEVFAPLVDMSKAEIVQAGTALGVDYGITVSCYSASPEGLACGRCDSCDLRRAGFVSAGLSDPTRYQEARS